MQDRACSGFQKVNVMIDALKILRVQSSCMEEPSIKNSKLMSLTALQVTLLRYRHIYNPESTSLSHFEYIFLFLALIFVSLDLPTILQLFHLKSPSKNLNIANSILVIRSCAEATRPARISQFQSVNVPKQPPGRLTPS
jgi:hypothetical protein